METLSAFALAQWLADASRLDPQLLDVREPWEIALGKIPGSLSIPLRDLSLSIHSDSATLNKKAPMVCICHHGVRSEQAAYLLETRGFLQVFNLQGGMDAWARTVDPSMKTY